MDKLRMAKAGLVSLDRTEMDAIVVDLSGRSMKVRVPIGVNKITVDIGPIGSLLFLRTENKDAITGAPIFAQWNPLKPPPEGKVN